MLLQNQPYFLTIRATLTRFKGLAAYAFALYKIWYGFTSWCLTKWGMDLLVCKLPSDPIKNRLDNNPPYLPPFL